MNVMFNGEFSQATNTANYLVQSVFGRHERRPQLHICLFHRMVIFIPKGSVVTADDSRESDKRPRTVDQILIGSNFSVLSSFVFGNTVPAITLSVKRAHCCHNEVLQSKRPSNVPENLRRRRRNHPLPLFRSVSLFCRIICVF